MSHTFDTKRDALDAGYTTVNVLRDRDVSGHRYRGYDFERDDGLATVDVWLNKERNKGGGLGCVAIMYPPQQETL